jgi:hypothetical protein
MRKGREDRRFLVTTCFFWGVLAFCETSLESSHNLSGEERMCYSKGREIGGRVSASHRINGHIRDFFIVLARSSNCYSLRCAVVN